MQRQGAQQGRVDDDTLHMLEDVIRGKVLAIRRRHKGRAKHVLTLLMAMLRRGLRSRLESLRQVSAAIQDIADEVWPSVEFEQEVPAEKHAQWLSKFWKSMRGVCRRAAHRARRELLRAREREVPDMEMDSDPEPLQTTRRARVEFFVRMRRRTRS